MLAFGRGFVRAQGVRLQQRLGTEKASVKLAPCKDKINNTYQHHTSSIKNSINNKEAHDEL